MIEKIFDKLGSISEVNQAAADLRKLRMKEALIQLVEKYHVPKQDAENYYCGKRYFLVDGGNTVKNFDTARSKLLDEMFTLNEPMFGNVIGTYLLSCCDNAEYEEKILLEHKTLMRCIEYVMGKAYELVSDEMKIRRENAGVGVLDEQVYGWIREYYFLDDEQQIREKSEEAEKCFKKRNAPPKATASNAGKMKKSGAKKQKESKKMEKKGKGEQIKSDGKGENADSKKSERGQVDGQFSLFSPETQG